MGIKKQGKVSKLCTNCFAPQYLKFNLSYITYEENFDDKHKIQLWNRMRELSMDPLITILNRDKKIGFEFEQIDVSKKIPIKFQERFDSKEYNDKLAIFRLYPNNNPIVARIIGVLIKNIFYIFFIDIGGKLYRHN